ncbi:hypothetical protein [Paenibacillus sp. N3.4]|uniref:hypothetical protein n=1 Tax=Paenibacillus sp. N3.4 TaxID=2603222 RepID=UPI0037C546EC
MEQALFYPEDIAIQTHNFFVQKGMPAGTPDLILLASLRGLLHKDTITACMMTPEGKEIQTFSTKTVFLLQLID